uniref:Uncharacterized protein n=1 Tax=Ciona savignyi TaxID=51511 RepID=H2YXJ1_CIOSA
MSEKGTKICLITINVICLICGLAMFVGGLLLQLNPTVKQILSGVATAASQSQLAIIAVVLIALGAFVTFVAFVGCCGAVSESRCLLSMYFISLLVLLLAQIGIAIAALVIGAQGFTDIIDQHFGILVRGYGTDVASQGVVDSVQQTFSCCGYNGPGDYINYNPAVPTMVPPVNATTPNANNTAPVTAAAMVPAQGTSAPAMVTTGSTSNATSNMTTMTTPIAVSTAAPIFYNGTWPDSCCVRVNNQYVNLIQCKNNSLSKSQLQAYLNTKGCTSSIAEFTKQYLVIIGAVGLGIALIEIIAMIASCSLRKALD